jgi:hypothetical protein
MPALSHKPVIPRTVGIVCIALGFVSGLQGLEEPGSVWMPTALGLIATGLIAQGYALYCTVMRARQASGTPRR